MSSIGSFASPAMAQTQSATLARQDPFKSPEATITFKSDSFGSVDFNTKTIIDTGNGNDQIHGHINDDGSMILDINGCKYHLSKEQAANLEIRAGNGEDMVTFSGKATGCQPDIKVCGGNGDDLIGGGKGNDELHGGAGNDEIGGYRGNDRIFGGDGDDTLKGWKGNDEIHGGRGDDAINGQKGHDHLFGGEGNDKLNGGDGFDYLKGGRGSDGLKGGDGIDVEIQGK